MRIIPEKKALEILNAQHITHIKHKYKNNKAEKHKNAQYMAHMKKDTEEQIRWKRENAYNT